jgi:hypothetical protein
MHGDADAARHHALGTIVLVGAVKKPYFPAMPPEVDVKFYAFKDEHTSNSR